MGVGLAIWKKVEERHGWRVWVKSEAGKGMKLPFALPTLGLAPPSVLGT